MEARILTRHPEPGKSGVNVAKKKYDLMRETILEAIRARGEIALQDLLEDVEQRLAGRFDGSIPWYVITIKLDLEARGLIERIPGSKPQRVCLSGQGKSTA
jgi:hypothetical protein